MKNILKVSFFCILLCSVISCTPVATKTFRLSVAQNEVDNKLSMLCSKFIMLKYESVLKDKACWETPDDYYPWSHNGYFNYVDNNDIKIFYRFNIEKQLLEIIFKELREDGFSSEGRELLGKLKTVIED